MSQRNSGEMTESYSTYIRRHLYTWIVGVLVGWLTLAIGVYTTWYQQAGSAIWSFHMANPILFALEGGCIGVVVTVIYVSKPKFKVR